MQEWSGNPTFFNKPPPQIDEDEEGLAIAGEMHPQAWVFLSDEHPDANADTDVEEEIMDDDEEIENMDIEYWITRNKNALFSFT